MEIEQIKTNGRCFTVVSVIAECWHIKLRHVKPLSHSTAIPRRWHGDLKFLRAPWDRTKILKNVANNFTFSITWRCHGAPTATVAFPRSAYGVPPRSQGVLTGDWLRSHGALTACSWRAKSCQCASTACTQRARRAHSAHGAPNAFPRRVHGVFMSIWENKCPRHIAETVMHINGSWVMWDIYLFSLMLISAFFCVLFIYFM